MDCWHGPSWLGRLWYAFVTRWPSVTALTILARVVFVVVERVTWVTWVATAASYLLLMTLILRGGFRTEARWRAYARDLGWRYSVRGPSIASYRVDAPPFEVSHGHRALLHATGKVRGRVCESFWLGADRIRRIPPIFVVLVQLDREFPTLRLTPGSRLKRDVGAKAAVEVESVDFNRRWMIRSSDPEFAHAFLSPQVMQRILAEASPPPSITVSGRYMFVHGMAGGVDAPAFAALLADLAALVPRGVIAKFARIGAEATRRPENPVEEVVARDALDHARSSPAPDTGRYWVKVLLLLLMGLVPLVGPAVASVIMAIEVRRGHGGRKMLKWALILTFAEVFLILFLVLIL